MILLFSDSRMGVLPAEQISDLLVLGGFASSDFYFFSFVRGRLLEGADLDATSKTGS